MSQSSSHVDHPLTRRCVRTQAQSQCENRPYGAPLGRLNPASYHPDHIETPARIVWRYQRNRERSKQGGSIAHGRQIPSSSIDEPVLVWRSVVTVWTGPFRFSFSKSLLVTSSVCQAGGHSN